MPVNQNSLQRKKSKICHYFSHHFAFPFIKILQLDCHPYSRPTLECNFCDKYHQTRFKIENNFLTDGERKESNGYQLDEL